MILGVAGKWSCKVQDVVSSTVANAPSSWPGIIIQTKEGLDAKRSTSIVRVVPHAD